MILALFFCINIHQQRMLDSSFLALNSKYRLTSPKCTASFNPDSYVQLLNWYLHLYV